MFGAYRFVLASLVLVEHSRLIESFHVGTTAVMCFFVLSGYCMHHSFSEHFGNKKEGIVPFYLDRFLRIYPLYIFIGLATISYFLATDSTTISLNAWSLFNNFSIIPLGFWSLLKGDYVYMLYENTAFLVGPANSLGVELHFYAILPILLLVGVLPYLLLPISLIIFVLSSVGYENYFFSGSSMTGVFFMFLQGIILFRISKLTKVSDMAWVLATNIFLCIFMLVLLLNGNTKGSHKEIIVGSLVGCAAVWYLARFKAKSGLDRFLGNLSYPIFLGHPFVIENMRRHFWPQGSPVGVGTQFIINFSLMLVISTLLVLAIEEPLNVFRKRIQVGFTKNLLKER